MCSCRRRRVIPIACASAVVRSAGVVRDGELGRAGRRRDVAAARSAFAVAGTSIAEAGLVRDDVDRRPA